MSTYFIADLHLSEYEPHITDLFLQFMAEKVPLAESLYILGDLFDFWIGDDEQSALISQVKSAIRNLTEQGVPCYFICGNRDFLLGKRFANECGMTLLPDYQLIDLYGKKTLLCHGDTLCIDDVKYQKFRQKVHQKWRQWLFLCLPLKWRIRIAEKIRAKSKADKKGKSLQMMDVNPEFTAQKMAEFGAKWLIHGHTHRQAVHLFPPTPPTVGLPPKGEENVSQHFSQDSFLPPLGGVPDKVGGRGQIRIVLGDWGKTASILEVTADGFQFNEKR